MNETQTLFLLIGAFLLLAAALFLLSRRRSLPAGKVVYDDLVRGEKPEAPLYSKRYGLAGKPDMIIRRGKEIIPIELKHAPAGKQPYPGHVLQLAAYCLLIEEHYGIRPAYGLIRYRDRQFEIPYTAELEQKLMKTMAAIRAEDPRTGLPPKCGDSRKCAHCGYGEVCDGSHPPAAS